MAYTNHATAPPTNQLGRREKLVLIVSVFIQDDLIIAQKKVFLRYWFKDDPFIFVIIGCAGNGIL
jgi:hypothetical protein